MLCSFRYDCRTGDSSFNLTHTWNFAAQLSSFSPPPRAYTHAKLGHLGQGRVRQRLPRHTCRGGRDRPRPCIGARVRRESHHRDARGGARRLQPAIREGQLDPAGGGRVPRQYRGEGYRGRAGRGPRHGTGEEGPHGGRGGAHPHRGGDAGEFACGKFECSMHRPS